MNTGSKTRLKIAGVLTALVLTGAACSSDSDETTDTTAASGNTTTTMLTPTGSACSQVPTEGEGSVAGMADDTVGTAASNNPLLTTLVTAVTEAGLVDTLNGAGPFTVFAPVNDAFAKVPEADLTALLANKEQLTSVLTYHVVPERLTASDLSDGESVTTVQGATINVSVDGDAVKVNDSNVICANVPVANGVVHLIDTVMMPPAS